jgi:hypothetical protein
MRSQKTSREPPRLRCVSQRRPAERRPRLIRRCARRAWTTAARFGEFVVELASAQTERPGQQMLGERVAVRGRRGEQRDLDVGSTRGRAQSIARAT